MRLSITMARTASASLSVGNWVSPATVRRTALYDIVFGSAEATPADGASVWELQRCTTAGTSTAVTPQAIDSADGTPTITAGQNHTVDPTLTANAILLSVGLNQRATYRWVAQPGGEILTPATSANGIAVRTPTAALVACRAVSHIIES